MSILRYYKDVKLYEIPLNSEVLAVIRNCESSPKEYLYTFCALGPVRNRGHLTVSHPRCRVWEGK